MMNSDIRVHSSFGDFSLLLIGLEDGVREALGEILR